MPTTLHQIIALEKGVKAAAQRTLTDAYHTVQKTPLLSGISRVYQPKDEEGETLPPEATRVQVKAEQVMADAAKALTRMFDLVATKDWANRDAHADVVVDGQVLLHAVPVTYLLWLEKQLADVHTLIGKLPTLDPAENWREDPAAGVWRADEVRTHRTRKTPRNHVKAEATQHHPAQVEVYMEDVTVGTWATTRFSGALPAARVAELAERVVKLQDSVKIAREQANSVPAPDQHVGEAIFGYLLG